MGALSDLEDVLLNPQIRTQSGTVPNNPEHQRSQNDPHPEEGPSVYQSRHLNDSDPDEAPHNILREHFLASRKANQR